MKKIAIKLIQMYGWGGASVAVTIMILGIIHSYVMIMWVLNR